MLPIPNPSMPTGGECAPPEKLAVSVNDFCKMMSIGRTTGWKAIAQQQVKVVRIGRRTLVTTKSIKAFLKRLANEGVR